MDPAIQLSMALLAVFAVCISVVSLALHWARRGEHPDVTRLDTAMQELRTQQIDLLDKVEHWVRRDRVRRLRASQEPSEPPETQAPARGSAEYKAWLRQKIRGVAS